MSHTIRSSSSHRAFASGVAPRGRASLVCAMIQPVRGTGLVRDQGARLGVEGVREGDIYYFRAGHLPDVSLINQKQTKNLKDTENK